MTAPLFRDDAYLRETAAKVVALKADGGVVLDQTVFYATGGGQPGDTGALKFNDGGEVAVTGTIRAGAESDEILHLVQPVASGLEPGAAVRAVLDWPRRYRHMRGHTAMHLLCAITPFPVTGGQVTADGGRLDFDASGGQLPGKDELTEKLNALIAADHPVSARWISDEELSDRPELVRTMSVQPPMGKGRVRLIAIGEDGCVDLQPCGGTHVRATGEIGPVKIAKIENKGRQNRRVRMVFAEN